ncbi:uncharacterized protein MELLADRAFT_110298 [Melampsora larici-populina 98AG31]|uniref:Uncharacterized protein n=1 Tax=Melampsora larici-populina (strain 98AG31 / pathotype 3-4-7) TaxID=747676 RepID=F4RZB0_MELLP|nr:uncharacterized protein MELLADRAFT_110298 [Melampsora larici-populina 98AG31]EGG02284.1 hypothetical protein MELLADRAFT_110298 [Melampsora larici-populina 98AG31]
MDRSDETIARSAGQCKNAECSKAHGKCDFIECSGSHRRVTNHTPGGGVKKDTCGRAMLFQYYEINICFSLIAPRWQKSKSHNFPAVAFTCDGVPPMPFTLLCPVLPENPETS